MTMPHKTPSPAAPIIDLRNVTLSYDGERSVLANASMSLSEGDFRFLTGASGTGKTTLLKLIYMAHRPTNGKVSVFGHDVGALPAEQLPALRRRVGVVFQEFRLLEHLSAYENVALPLRVLGNRETDYRDDVMDLLKWVGLAHRADARPPILSGGEKQRVALARAVVSKPDLILADEPTGNVDPEMGQRIMSLLRTLNEMGTAVVVATHDMNLVRQTPAQIFRLRDGKITLHQPLQNTLDATRARA